MMADLPLPKATREFRDREIRPGEPAHVGLLLDKFSAPENQEAQKPLLAAAVDLFNGTRGERASDLEAARRRRLATLGPLSPVLLEARLATPLAIHLARASALENAGLAMHRTQGFPILPATGLKGMARAFATEIERAPAARVLAVLGNEPGSAEASAGSVVFHDGWPVDWPTLAVDIANNHHVQYYGGTGAPGDFETPNMIYFPAVEPGVRFEFPLHARRPGAPAADLEDARRWLAGGLAALGAGAKTASGYGWFDPPAGAERAARPGSAVRRYRVELVTPGFLAGARQAEADATLRPATLKAQLRWWWRTMHAGALSSKDLLALEGRIFGSTEAQSLVEVVVEPEGDPARMKAPYKSLRGGKLEFDDAFAAKHRLHRTRGNNLPVGYAAYGMAERDRHRCSVEPGARWKVELRARGEGRTVLSAETVLEQAEVAFALLCRYGAVGSKARKGFGSLAANGLEEKGAVAALATIDVPAALAAGKRLRDELRLGTGGAPASRGGASSLDAVAATATVPTPWTDAWYAMNEVGAAMNAVAGAFKHQKEKVALGLPRKIHGPKDSPMGHQDASRHQRPEPLRGAGAASDGNRHASPVHLSLSKSPDGTLAVNVLAFVAALLPDAEKSRRFLGDYVKKLEEALRDRIAMPPASGQPAPRGPGHGHGGPPRRGGPPGARPGGGGRDARPAPPPPPAGPRPGDVLAVTLVWNEGKKRMDAELTTPAGPRKGLFKGDRPPEEAKAGAKGKAKLLKPPPAGKGDLWELSWVGE